MWTSPAESVVISGVAGGTGGTGVTVGGTGVIVGGTGVTVGGTVVRLLARMNTVESYQPSPVSAMASFRVLLTPRFTGAAQVRTRVSPSIWVL